MYNINADCFDDNFKRSKIDLKETWERTMLDPLYEENVTLNQDFSISEVRNVIKRAKKKKAVGIDRIPNELLKQDPIAQVLTGFFQTCFETGLIPDIWRQALIHPIPKDPKKDKKVPLNYRGISLLSTVSKLYTSLLNKRILDYEELSGNLADEQNGFRPNRNCCDHIFSLTSIIRNRKNAGLSTFCCFVDYQKAFDFIDRDLLLYKLQLYQINGKIYNAISGLYTNTSACVLLNQFVTPWFDTTSGVRQGDSLSPTLFALYINDLVDEINSLDKGISIDSRKISLLLYADDLVVLTSCEEDLNIMLNTINNWCKKWRVLVNREKSKVVHFRPKRIDRTESNFYLGNDTLEVVTEYKYLGVYLNEFLLYENTADTLSKSATRALGSVLNKFRSLKNMGFQSYTKLFDACVTPVLDYASEVWGFKDYNSSERVKINALRYFFGVHKFAAHQALYGDSGWIPGYIDRRCNMVRLWNRLVNMDESRLTKMVFNYDKSLKKHNWSSEVHEILKTCDMEEKFVQNEVCDIRLVKSRLVNIFKTGWPEGIANLPKLRTYALFKQEHGTEKYLNFDLNRRERSILAQFRFGILPLRVETGRFTGERLEDRKCIFCTEETVEDEFHILLKCDQYNKIREKTLGFVNLNVNINESVLDLMDKGIRKITSFLIETMQKRQEILSKK